MTWIELAQEEAGKFGIALPPELADYYLWEETAFPYCDELTVREQLREVLQTNLAGLRAQYPTGVRTAYDRLKEDDSF